MNFKKTLLPLSAVSVALLLTACEPTDSDISNAISSEINKANAESTKLVGEKMAKTMNIQFISAKKIGCKEAQGAPGYVCDVEVTAKAPFVGQQTQTTPIRFVKGDNGWQATDTK